MSAWLCLELVGLAIAHAASPVLPATPAGMSEAGVPATVINAPESLGLSSFPTDISLFPDGRLLVVTPTEFAVGDGIRWEVIRRDDGVRDSIASAVVIDDDGQIYTGTNNGAVRIDFVNRGRWRVSPAVSFKENGAPGDVVLSSPLQVGRDWFWRAASGPVWRWRPGAAVERLGVAQSIEHLFVIGDRIYFNSWGSGGLFALRDGKSVQIWDQPANELSAAVSSATPFDGKRVLLAVQPNGLALFDGTTVTPFPTNALMRSNARVSYLCAAGPDHFAAAIDGVGIAFFDRTGRVVQVIDTRSDQRLGRIQKMVYSQDGLLWVLMNDGIARIEFPGRVSTFETLVATGLNFASPIRHQGKLWLHADGRALEGIYDEQGRLNDFVVNTPPGRFAFAMASVQDNFFAGSELGLFRYGGRGWEKVAAGMVNPRVTLPPDRSGVYTYVARGECGRLRPVENGRFDAERFPVPQMGDVFAVIAESDDVHWLELGGGTVGRIDWRKSRPQVDIYDRTHGLPGGWVQISSFDGAVHFLGGGLVYRFDPAQQRFVQDDVFREKYPWIIGSAGRPSRDPQGRIWYASQGRAHVIDPSAANGSGEAQVLPQGIEPFFFLMQEDGVVWMHQRRRLLRFDPKVTLPTARPSRALITQVEFASGRSTLFGPLDDLGAIDAEANSFTVHFMAPGNPFAAPTTFEFRLEGGEDRWISTGVAGSASFNEMKEGHYTLHVRPLIDGSPQAETRVTFKVLPPWYRHPIAYGAYSALGIGALALAGLLSTYLQRREKERLERLVAERTSAVEDANRQLARQVAETLEKSRELRSSEERYRTLYENNPAMYFTIDAEWRILSVNQYGADQIGYTVSELVGREMAMLFHPEDREAASRLASECFASPGKLGHWSLRKMRKDGRILPVKEMARAVRQSNGSLVLFMVCEDVSTQVQLEAQLRQAQKMEAIGQLAGGVAHDFNNLLTVIHGQAEWSENHASTPEERLESVREIRRAAEQAGKLTRQLLVFSRQQSVRSEAADLNDVVARVVKLIQRVIGEDITIISTFSSEFAPVRVDSAMVEQVLINMALNARDAMPKGGRLRLDVSPASVTAERVAGKDGVRPGRFHCISVTDTGSGMSEAVKARVFEPFFTTKAPGHGTGLGLATSATIVSQHQGWIEVQSELGVGTTFRIYLPETREVSRPPIAVAPAAPAPRGQETILLVEDEPAVRQVTRRMLEKHGYKVIEAENADDALAKWGRFSGEIDLLLTDLLMPGSMNGRQLAEHLGKVKPSLHIRLMSGHDPDVLARKEGSGGFMRPHLLKPFTRDSLLSAIRR